MFRKSTDLELLASTLAKLLGPQSLARVLDALLGCEADGRLSDAEAAAGDKLFLLLCDLRPDAVDVAMNGTDCAA